MESGLWDDCSGCEKKCCGWKNTLPLFITKKEHSVIKMKGFDTSELKGSNPCAFFNKDKKCNIYKVRPTDCRLFPFDIHKADGELNWIVWKNCPISEKLDKEIYLTFLEKKFKQFFKKHLEDYASFRGNERITEEFELLRKITI